MKEPKIRLKGFSGEWEETTIGDIASVVGGGTPSTGNPSYWNGPIQWFTPSEVGHIKYVDKSERTITTDGIDSSSAKIIPAKSLLLSSRATIGEASINLCECTTNQGFQSLIPNNVDLEFLYSMMVTKKRDLIRESNGSTFLEISASKVRSVKICIPSKDEQQALGTYFQHLDSLIQSTTKKIESLKQVKAASLQSMFPQEGETVPRVRFKGFEGEWETKFLNSFLTPSSLKNRDGKYTKEDVLSVSGEFGIVNQIAFQGRSFAGVSVANYGVVEHKDIVYTKSPLKTSPYGIIKTNEGEPGIVSTLYAVYKCSEDANPTFVQYYFDLTSRLNSYLRPLVRKGAKNDMKVSAKDALLGKVIFPSLDEQQAIASYFTNLDNQISLQTKRLDKLKQIKSACLDNMFV